MTATMPHAVKVLVVGDDLSGTADCAVTCTRHGLACQVILGPAMEAPAEEVAVLAIDADTRRNSRLHAAQINHALWLGLGQGRKLYKKIDSTLRGNVAAEVAALTRAGMAIVAPAFPAAGRTTVGGRQFVAGVPVEESEVWRNEQIAGRADVVAMLADTGLRVLLLGLDEVRQGVAAVRLRLLSCVQEGWQAVVCDSETEADLDIIARASAVLDEVFWVGSAGLAAPLVQQWAGVADLPSAILPAAEMAGQAASDGGVLLVVGSMSSISHQQIATLEQRAGGQVQVLSVSATDLFNPVSPVALTLGARVGQALEQGRSVLVSLDQTERMSPADGALLARQLAHHLFPAMVCASGLVATGGETARALLSAMGVETLAMVAAIETGVPLLTARYAGRVFPVVTKAGGFGQPETLFHAWRRLEGLRPSARRVPCQFSGDDAMTYRPIIGITMGDAAGVGPEIIMKSLAHAALYDGCRPLVIGDRQRLLDAGQRVGVDLAVRAISTPAEARFQYGEVDCIDLGLIPADLPYGRLSALAGDAAYQYIARTVELTSAGELDAICTAPLNKEALHAGGHIFPGHTEILAYLTGIPEVSMMLVAPRLRVIHVTTHIGLLDAINRIEPGLVQRTIERAHATLVRTGIANPRIGVCGINPHAGENGLFGYGEEETKIIPAVDVLKARGWDVEGPLPADTLFYRAGRGDFDVVVAMYHDQGHGPVKVMGLEAGVNVTVGLPVIRTSVDHGTAFDIAGKGIADEGSMLEAMKQAQDLATRRVTQTA